MQALVLAFVGIAITVAVYGAVALIVKADDVGAASRRTTAARPWGVSAVHSDGLLFSVCPAS